jgi:DASS family divalent anion:Na+ symporter
MRSFFQVQIYSFSVKFPFYSHKKLELLLAPFVPSNTARGGGIVLPVVHSIATTLGSTPSHQPKVGGFLMLVGAHANLLSASMFLTGNLYRIL